MANELDEITGSTNAAGRDINVIDKQLSPKTGPGSTLFEIALWLPGIIFAIIGWLSDHQFHYLWFALGFLPGVIYIFAKVEAKNYFRQLQQQIQSAASEIDNYMEQRVQILQNAVNFAGTAVKLDKDVMTSVAALRGGGGARSDTQRNEFAGSLDQAFGRFFPQVEAYPDLKAHAAIADAMRQNSYLQKEITAARTFYNDKVTMWNSDIFAWPVKMIVAARAGYTTRIPFIASAETKAQARKALVIPS